MNRQPRRWADLRAAPYPKVDPERAEFHAAMYRLSLNPDFQQFMRWLRLTSTEMVLSSAAPDSALRVLEGRRQVPRDIEGLIERGRSGSAKPNTDAA